MLVLPLLLLACECRLQPLAPADHYPGMGALKHAVYEADLEQVRRLAIQLEGGEVVRDAGAEGREAEGDLHAAVGLLVICVDAVEAGEGLAAIGRACGRCHRAEQVQVLATARLPDPDDLSTQHSELAETSWWALVAADASGAQAALELAAAQPILEGSELAGQLRAVARGAEEPLAGAEALLATQAGSCAACHAAKSEEAVRPAAG